MKLLLLGIFVLCITLAFLFVSIVLPTPQRTPASDLILDIKAETVK